MTTKRPGHSGCPGRKYRSMLKVYLDADQKSLSLSHQSHRMTLMHCRYEFLHAQTLLDHQQ